MRLQGKVAVVTGTAGGIGRAAALRFAAEGAAIVAADRLVAANEETVAQVTGIPVEHHMWVELDGTKSVLELAGQTEVYWPKAETIVDKEAGLSLKLAEGWQQMPPEQALSTMDRA